MGFPSIKFVMTWDFNASVRYLFSSWCSTMVFKNYCFCRINSPDFHKWKQNFGDSVQCVKSVLIRSLFSGPYFPVFSPNTGKYGPAKTLHLDSFHAWSEIWPTNFFACFSFDFLFFTFANTMIVWLLNLFWATSLNFSSLPIVYL